MTKAIGLPEVHGFSLCHEFVGAKLARLADLDAPDSALVNLAEAEVVDAARIYVFDLFVQNADRRSGSPNCGRAGGRIVPYDFENAFGFRFALAPPEPWRASALGFTAQHLFYRQLRQHERNWPDIFAPFTALKLADLVGLCGTLPEAWTAIGAEILAHIESVLAHWQQFSQEVAATFGDPL